MAKSAGRGSAGYLPVRARVEHFIWLPTGESFHFLPLVVGEQDGHNAASVGKCGEGYGVMAFHIGVYLSDIVCVMGVHSFKLVTSLSQLVGCPASFFA